MRDPVLKRGWAAAGLGIVAVAAAVFALRGSAPVQAPAGPRVVPMPALEATPAPDPAAPREAPVPVDAGLLPNVVRVADAAAPGAPAAAPVTEESLLSRLRADVDARPAVALELARESERRFPAGRHAEERSLLKMRSLVHLNQIAAARDEATVFFQRTPDSPFAEQVYRLTGVHPRPRLPGR